MHPFDADCMPFWIAIWDAFRYLTLWRSCRGCGKGCGK
jgi:hypothetical protein